MIRHFKQFITNSVVVTLIASFFLTPVAAFAATYGSGSYGSCAFGTGCTTSSNSNPIASSISSVGNTIAAFFCTDQAPSSAPNLYQIDVKSTTAKLYFSPAGNPYDKHYVAYGQGNNSDGYGAEFNTSNNKSALTYEVKLLAPSTVYTFKVRGGNGCKPGPWSNTLTIKTQGKGVSALAKFYPKQQAQFVQAKPASWIQQAQAYVGNILPKAAPKTGQAEAKQHIKSSQIHSASTKQSSQPSLWVNIKNFFTNLFR